MPPASVGREQVRRRVPLRYGYPSPVRLGATRGRALAVSRPLHDPGPDRQCDEYPAGTMYLMRGVATVTGDGGKIRPGASRGRQPFILYLCALWIAWSLERMGARTVLFAAAPVLVTAGTLNWDLVPVAFATAGTLAFLRGRDTRSGALLGLGAFVKLYPGLLAIPFALERLRAGAKDRAARLVAVTGGVWLVANLPFAILGFAGWVWFFRYNSRRPRTSTAFGRCSVTCICVRQRRSSTSRPWVWRRRVRGGRGVQRSGGRKGCRSGSLPSHSS